MAGDAEAERTVPGFSSSARRSSAHHDTANFRQLVLGCMDSYDSEQWLILQGFSKSTRFAFFCTALIAEIQQIFVKIFGDFAENVAKICKNLKISAKFCKICVQKSANFEIGAAQKNANLVDFEKPCKMSLWSLS